MAAAGQGGRSGGGGGGSGAGGGYSSGTGSGRSGLLDKVRTPFWGTVQAGGGGLGGAASQPSLPIPAPLFLRGFSGGSTGLAHHGNPTTLPGLFPRQVYFPSRKEVLPVRNAGHRSCLG